MRFAWILLLAVASSMLVGCDGDTYEVVQEIWHETTEHIWHETRIETVEQIHTEHITYEEDTTPDVVQEFYYPSGPVPCLVLVEGGMPAMADQPLSGLTEATSTNPTDLMLITQAGTSKKVEIQNITSVPYPPNHIHGLITSNNGTDADHDIDIAAGGARDSTDTENMVLSSSITKQIDATWAVGTNQGGLDTGTVASGTLYALWLIKRSDTGVVDVLFSTSFSSPTMPTNYDLKRLIGAVRTDSSANCWAYVQQGDYFAYIGDSSIMWPIDVVDTTITNLSWETGTLTSVPPDCQCDLIFDLNNQTSTSPQDGQIFYRPKGATFSSAPPAIEVWNTGTFDRMAAAVKAVVDGSQQIEYAAAESSGSATLSIYVAGFQMSTRREP